MEGQLNNVSNDKRIIYLRTSTEEQNPENQLKDCLTLVKIPCKHIEEQQSAWKDKDRPKFEAIKKQIKSGQINELIVWDLDRVYRNRKKLNSFFAFCKMYNCKVNSFRQQWLNDLNNIPEPFNEIMHSLMLSIMGWLAQDESDKRSMRVKSAVRRDSGITKSRKGKKWGRKEVKNKKMIEDVIRLKTEQPKLSLVKIAEQVYYYDKSNNKKQPSKFVVFNILKKYREEKALEVFAQ